MPFDQVNFTMPAVETDELLNTLLKGRARIVGGWCKGAYNAGGDAYCMHGAVAGDERLYERARDFLAEHLPSSVERFCLPCMRFNDAPDTTKEDVVAVFDRAIAARRKELEHV